MLCLALDGTLVCHLNRTLPILLRGACGLFRMCEQAIRDSPSCFLTNELLSLVLTWGDFSSLAEASGPCPMGLACFAVACVFHDSNPRSHVRKIVRTVVSQFLMSLYFLFPT